MNTDEMGRVEALEAQVRELEGELRDVLDEYVEVQGRIRTLEAVTGSDSDANQAGEQALADLPNRLREVAASAPSPRASSSEDRTAADARSACASQEEVAAAVERVEADEASSITGASGTPTGESTSTPNATTADETDTDDDGLGDIIIG